MINSKVYKMKVLWRNVKYPRIDLRDGDIRIIAPPGTDIDALLESKKDWIEKNMKKIKEIRKRAQESIKREGITILDRKLMIKENYKNPGIMGNEIFVCSKKGKREKLKSMLKDEINELVDEYSKKLGVKPNKIFIREQRTKWGSCSSRGNLNFNLALIFTPSHFRRYLVAHEMVHLIYPNHGKEFKATLKNLGVRIPEKDEMLYYWYYAEECKEKLLL